MIWTDIDKDIINIGFLLLVSYAAIAGMTANGIWPLRAIRLLIIKIRVVQYGDTSALGQETRWETRAALRVPSIVLGYLVFGIAAAILFPHLSIAETDRSTAELLSWVIIPLAYLFAYLGSAVLQVLVALLIALGVVTLMRKENPDLGRDK